MFRHTDKIIIKSFVLTLPNTRKCDYTKFLKDCQMKMQKKKKKTITYELLLFIKNFFETPATLDFLLFVIRKRK